MDMGANKANDNKNRRFFATGGGRAFRNSYPKAAACIAFTVAFLLVVDLLLVYKRIEYGRELSILSSSLTRAEAQRVNAIEAAEKNMMAVTVELARRLEMDDADLHLVVDSGKGLMYLQHEGAALRVMKIRMGAKAIVGEKPDTVCLAPPRGKRMLVRVVDETYPWEMPVCTVNKGDQPVQGDRAQPGALGPLALILDGGSVIYTQPNSGPLSDPDYVLPGSVRAEKADIEAIKDDLQPGMAVYFL